MGLGLTIIRLHLAIYFLPFQGGSGQKAAWPELCRIIEHLGSGMIRPFAQNIWDQSCTFFNRDREIVGRSHRELRQLEISLFPARRARFLAGLRATFWSTSPADFSLI